MMNETYDERTERAAARPMQFFTPRVYGSEHKRWRINIDGADVARIENARKHGRWIMFFDTVTGVRFRVRGAACTIRGCNCDAVAQAVPPSSNFRVYSDATLDSATGEARAVWYWRRRTAEAHGPFGSEDEAVRDIYQVLAPMPEVRPVPRASDHDSEACYWCRAGEHARCPMPDYPDAHVYIGAVGWETLCRRTEDPKLAWIEDQLQAQGIPSRRHGRSFHAPILQVPANRLEAAEAWLQSKLRGRVIDDIPDDSKTFAAWRRG